MTVAKKDENEVENNGTNAGDIGAESNINAPDTNTAKVGTGAGGSASLSSSGGITGASQSTNTDSTKSGQLSSAGKRFAGLKKFRDQNKGQGIQNRITSQANTASSNVKSDAVAASDILSASIDETQKDVDAGNAMDTKDVSGDSHGFSYTPNEDGTFSNRTDEEFSFQGKDNIGSFQDASIFTAGKNGDYGGTDYDVGGVIGKQITNLENRGQNLQTETGRYKVLQDTYGSGRRSYNSGNSIMDQMLIQGNEGVRNSLTTLGKGLGKESREMHTADTTRASDATTDFNERFTGIAKNLTDQVGGNINTTLQAGQDVADAQKTKNETDKAAIDRYKDNDGTFTAADAESLGFELNPDGTWNDFGALNNGGGDMLDVNLDGQDLAKATSVNHKNKLAALDVLSQGGIDSGILENTGANNTLNPDGTLNVGQFAGPSDVKGGITEESKGKFDTLRSTMRGNYEQSKQDVVDFDNTPQGSEGSILPAITGEVMSAFGTSAENLSKLNNKQISELIGTRQSALHNSINKNNGFMYSGMPGSLRDKLNSDIRQARAMIGYLDNINSTYTNPRNQLSSTVAAKEENFQQI